MTDSNIAIQDREASVNAEDTREKTDTQKSQADGENPGSEKKEHNTEKKSMLNEEVKSTLLFAATSVIAGYISFILTPAKPAAIPATSLLLVFGAMIAVFFGTQTLIQKLAGKKNMHWIMGNGGAIYLFLWFVSWIIFYNAM